MNSTQTPDKVTPERIAELLTPVPLGPLPESPLVSVLIGNYNYARFLGEAIESVLNQTYTNFELIVCDDGSTDDSCLVVEQFVQRDPRVRLIRKENRGQASAWNTANQESKGDIICFLDSDDRCLRQKLKLVVQAFHSNPDSGFLGHRMYKVDSSGCRNGVLPSTADPPSGWYGPFMVRSGTFPPAMAIGSALCLRREICELIFPLPEGLKTCADAVVMTLAPMMTPLIGLPTPLVEYRYHGNNSWNSPDSSTESMDRLGDLQRQMWDLSRRYLEKTNPTLLNTFPSFEKCQGTLLRAYIRARMGSWSGALSAYLDLRRSESFATIRPAWRWFWGLSILLPPPVFRYALGPDFRQLVWKVKQAFRRTLREGASATDRAAI